MAGLKFYMKNYLKAFVVTSSLVVVIFPAFVYFFFSRTVNPDSTYLLMDMNFMGLAFMLGIFNMIYYSVKDKFFSNNATLRYLIFGLIQGLILASLGGFVFEIPELLQLPLEYQYLPLIVAPIIYALLWLLVIRPLNLLFDLN